MIQKTDLRAGEQRERPAAGERPESAAVPEASEKAAAPEAPEKAAVKKRPESVASALLKFSAPLVLSGILQQLYSWADAFIVGNVDGELALAAVGSTTTIINFYIMALTGFTLGLSILFAQKFGSRKLEEMPQILSTFALLLGGVFLALAAAGFCWTPELLALMRTTEDTILLAQDYLQIIFLGVPFLAVYNVYAAGLRGLGDSRAPFWAVLISSVVNVGLDIFLVAVLDWNVTGAAVATVFSQIAMTVFLVGYGTWKYPALRFALGRHMIDRAALRQGLRMGFPPMIQSSISAFGGLILQNFMNGFGSQTVAAITTAYRVDTIVILPMTNLGAGISTLVAQSYGAGETRKIRKIFAVGTLMMVAVSILLTCLVIPMGGHLIALFGVGAEVVEIGRRFFRGLAVFYVVLGLATAIRGYLEGLGDVLYSSIAGILSLISRIAASYTMAAVFGNMIIAYGEAFSWGVLLLLYIGRLLWRGRNGKDRKQMEEYVCRQ